MDTSECFQLWSMEQRAFNGKDQAMIEYDEGSHRSGKRESVESEDHPLERILKAMLNSGIDREGEADCTTCDAPDCDGRDAEFSGEGDGMPKPKSTVEPKSEAYVDGIKHGMLIGEVNLASYVIQNLSGAMAEVMERKGWAIEHPELLSGMQLMTKAATSMRKQLIRDVAELKED